MKPVEIAVSMAAMLILLAVLLAYISNANIDLWSIIKGYLP